MEEITVYKTVHKNGDSFESCVVDTEDYNLQYQYGQETKSPGESYIFAFLSFEDALEFCKGREDRKVLTCVTSDWWQPQDESRFHVLPILELVSPERMERYWKNPFDYRGGYELPFGTVFCKSIRPIKDNSLYDKQNNLY